MLKATGIYKSYRMGRSDVHVLRGASLSVERGEFVVIMGASGSGKSTLLHILGALDAPDKGTVEFDGRSLFTMSDVQRRTYRNQQIGFVFQFYHLLPECNVLENVLMPKLVAHSLLSWRSARREAREAAEALLERVGLADRRSHRPNELSGGERQRVAIARALVNSPALLLADEPTGNLDAGIGGDILELLTELSDAGQTIVMVTHDPWVASRAHRQVELVEGVIRKGDTPPGTPSPARQVRREVAS